MRIGFITGEYPPMKGGVGAYTRIITNKLAEQGHEVYIFTDYNGTTLDDNVYLNSAVTRWNYQTIQMIKQWAKKHRLEIVNMQYQTAAYGMSPFIHFLPDALRNTAPFVTTFHDLRVPYLFPKAGPVREWIVHRLARASAGVIVTNQEDAQRIVNHPHCTLIPIGSNILTNEPSSANSRNFVNAVESDMMLAFFGFVNRQKGLEDLLYAIVRLREQGISAKLVMIGDRIGASDESNIPYAQEIDLLIAQLDLENNIYWTGYVNEADVRGYLTTADVVVLPYRDGASYRRGTLMAALQHGTAVVTTTPAIPVPVFVDHENMLLVEPGDVQGLTDALYNLYNSPSLNQHLRTGAKALSQRFSWDQIVTDYTNFYQQIIEDSA